MCNELFLMLPEVPNNLVGAEPSDVSTAMYLRIFSCKAMGRGMIAVV